MKPKVAQYKKDVVQKVVKLFADYPIIGTVNMENLPATAVQTMRAKLRGKAEIFMTKQRLMKVALKEVEKTKKGIEVLEQYFRGMPALLFTKENPFAIYKTIKQSKSPAAAKGGQIAPKDIVVKAGGTPFLPGPIIGELGAFGIKTGVENGKVAIKEDKVVVEEGGEISQELAGILSRLDIKPMEIGLDITAIFEEGTIYDRKVLDIDEDQFMADLSQAATWAHNLAMDVGHMAKELMPGLIAKAYNQSKNLAHESNFMADAVKEELLAKAHSHVMSLKTVANIPDAPAQPAEEKKEEAAEKPAEDAPKEAPAEEKKEAPKAEEPKPEAAEEKKEEAPKAEEQPKEEPEVKEEKKEEPAQKAEEPTQATEPVAKDQNQQGG